MKRRELLQSSAATALSSASVPMPVVSAEARPVKWMPDAALLSLQEALGERLIRPGLPWDDLRPGERAPAKLGNPWYLLDQPGGTQSTGMFGAWRGRASDWAVRAASAADIRAAVNVARVHGLRLVVKGAGGDYYGRSSGPRESLLVWTHDLRSVAVHRAFRAEGAPVGTPAVPAITVSAGNTWLHAYRAATAAGLYVQGGGCTTVGACGGFTQGGGFGSYSKRFGSGAAGVLQAEVVTGDGQLRIANAYRNSDLYWALKGGGGGTFGIVVRQTLLAHPMPRLDGWLSGSIEAADDDAFEQLIYAYLELVGRSLTSPDWGEGVTIAKGERRLQLGTAFLDLERPQAEAVWAPLLDRLRARPDRFTVQVGFRVQPFVEKWQPEGDSVYWDDRMPSGAGPFWWKGNQAEVGAYWGGYGGRGVPASLLQGEALRALAKAFFEASRHCLLLFQTNKGLAGIPADAESRQHDTAMNPAVLGNAGYVTLAAWVQDRYPGIDGHEPDPEVARSQKEGVERALTAIRGATPGGASYVNEGNFFETNWRDEFWGRNYPRLLDIKRRYDPHNLFRVHHGVGSEP